MSKRSRCKCGRVKSKHSNLCNKCHKERRESIQRKARQIVEKGTCPDCGLPLYRNGAIAGWYQCEAFPTKSHRKAKYINEPECSFQCFTQ